MTGEKGKILSVLVPTSRSVEVLYQVPYSIMTISGKNSILSVLLLASGWN